MYVSKFIIFFVGNSIVNTLYLDSVMVALTFILSVAPILGIFAAIFLHMDHYYYLMRLDNGPNSIFYVTVCMIIRLTFFSGFFRIFSSYVHIYFWIMHYVDNIL